MVKKLKNQMESNGVDVLFDKKLIRHKIKRIQTKLHRIRIGDVCLEFICLVLMIKGTY